MAKQVSNPMKSANSNGPIGWLAPNFKDVSIASTDPTPSYKVYIASLIIGIKIRFTIKAGKSSDLATVLPASLPNIMKAKKKPLDIINATDLGVDVSPRLKITNTGEPEARAAGIKVGSVDELVEKLKEMGAV